MPSETPYQVAQRWGQLSIIASRLGQAIQQQQLWNTRVTLNQLVDAVAELEKAKAIEIEVVAPRCWTDLVNVVFDEGEDHGLYFKRVGVLSARWRCKNNDPLPYYDDHREVSGRNVEGWRAEVHLCSGQGNYWGEIHIFEPSGECVYGSENSPIESFNNGEVHEIETSDGRTVLVTIRWE